MLEPPSTSRRPASPAGCRLLLLVVGLATSSCSPQAQRFTPPGTPVETVVETLHGVEISDPYRWLEDQESPRTRQWIEEQNTFTDSVLGELPGQDALRERFNELLKIDSIGFPVVRNGRYFFSKRRTDEDLFVIYLRRGADGEDQVLLDPHPLSADHTTTVGLSDVSKDGTLVVYSVREGGEDEITLKLMDVDNRTDLPDVLPRARYFGATLTPDKAGLYYTRVEKEGPRVFYHALGTDTSEDRQVFGHGYGPEKLMFGSLSEDGRYLVVHVLHGSADRSEVYLKDLSAGGEFVTVVNDLDARFQGTLVEDRLYLQTQWQAPNGRVMVADLKNPGRESWREWLPERKDSVIRSVSAAGGRFFVNYLSNVQSRVVAFDVDGNEIGKIAFDTIGTVSNVGGQWDSEETFFAFSSFHVPTTIYRYDVATGEREVWAQIDVPVDSERFEINQVWFTSGDGTEVPMFLVHNKGLELDNSRPTLLTGYGGFNSSLTPGFSASAAVWVERGGVYAVANLRGGGEFGEEWHRSGMLENKQNVFDDFIAAGEWLIDNDYTNPNKLAIRGGSNGGLLVGTVMNQRPDLFRAVICTYPLLDMIRYHQFLVAAYWVPEYGSSEDPEQFKYLHAYSPYHNVKPDPLYPAVLFITGDRDTRVAPLHARKMAALVQSTPRQRPVLLRYHTKAGHSGGQPVSEQVDNLVESYSFLLWQLNGET